jgi:endonuclease YncB( thermonuclease family)
MACRRALVLLPLLLVLLPAAARAVEWVGTVVGVADGDTLTLLAADQTPHRIRLDGIDAPEKAQPWGERAKQSLSALAYGRAAHADCAKSDRYGRAVCRVTVDGVDVGLEQVRRGMAWHYVRYAREQPPALRAAYHDAEQQARAARTGLWNGAQPTPPWDWRRGERGTAP